ncbi:uncharacterized protein KQ657_004498 [Scheffersomyces spartinae]|uniref:Uncharacterized protein n=1 Tax=Scheffersomyces spartinae TaxID=45513 RepID=A0A9P7VBE4_9ASCO|nr:uncharacterized protein KQ657_004498 [Scheffersomyces spartinae]KAG7194817.1 hypothetical protein KQ657_004498 [Scheffersomyces spartinae]
MDLSALSSDLPSTKAVSEASVKELAQELTVEFKNAAKAVAGLYNVAASANKTLGNDSTSTAKSAAALKQDFSDTAKSVASLYRLANTSTVLYRLKGYLDCLDEILEIIENGEDLENWVLTRKAEISNLHKADSSKLTNPVLLPNSHEPQIDNNQHNNNNTSSMNNANSTGSTILSSDNIEDFSIPQDFEFKMPDSLAVSHHFRLSHPPMSVQHSKNQIVQRKMMLNEIANRKRSLQINSQLPQENEHESDEHSNSEEESIRLDTFEGEESRKRRRLNECRSSLTSDED